MKIWGVSDRFATVCGIIGLAMFIFADKIPMTGGNGLYCLLAAGLWCIFFFRKDLIK